MLTDRNRGSPMSPKFLVSLVVLATGSSQFSLPLSPVEPESFGFDLVEGFPAGVSVNEAPYRSDAFGFEIAFPPGSIACAGFPGFFNRNYNSFYALYDSGSMTCASGQPRSDMTVLGIRATFNTAEWSRDDLLSDDCLDETSVDIDIAQVRTLSFPEHASHACLTRHEDGSIEIQVVTQAGEPASEGAPRKSTIKPFFSRTPPALKPTSPDFEHSWRPPASSRDCTTDALGSPARSTA